MLNIIFTSTQIEKSWEHFQDINLAMKQCFLTKIDRLAIPIWKLYIPTTLC